MKLLPGSTPMSCVEIGGTWELGAGKVLPRCKIKNKKTDFFYGLCENAKSIKYYTRQVGCIRQDDSKVILQYDNIRPYLAVIFQPPVMPLVGGK